MRHPGMSLSRVPPGFPLKACGNDGQRVQQSYRPTPIFKAVYNQLESEFLIRLVISF